MARFIVHIGAHKTGSSAVQHWLLANAKLLADHGILFPTDLVGNNGNAVGLAKLLTSAPISWTPEQRRVFRGLMARSADPTADMLISAEKFEIGLAEGRFGALGRMLDRHGITRRIAVFLIRNQADLYSSAYAQRLKRLNSRTWHLQAESATEDLERFDWWGQANRLRKAGFTPRLSVFRGKTGQMPVAQTVLSLAGLADRLPAHTDFRAPSINDSIGEMGVFIATRLVAMLTSLPKPVGVPVRTQLSDALIAALKGVPDRPFNAFDRVEHGMFMARFADGNQRLADLLPGGAAEVALLTSSRTEHADKSPTVWEQFSRDQQTTMVAVTSRLADVVAATPALDRHLGGVDIASVCLRPAS